MLTHANRTDLKRLGINNIRSKLAGSPGGRDAVLNRFLPSGDVSKGDVEDWLMENSISEDRRQRITFWIAIVSLAIAIASFAFTFWPTK